jgi:NADPH:quinone reductase-like Zn-dependent oxidoreductase
VTAHRVKDGYGADIVVDGISGEVLSEELKALALGGSLTTLENSASRHTTVEVTDLVVPQAASEFSIRSVSRRQRLLTLGKLLSLYFDPVQSNRSSLRRSLWSKWLRLCFIP